MRGLNDGPAFEYFSDGCMGELACSDVSSDDVVVMV